VFNPTGPRQNFNLNVTPLVVTQNPAADPSCQWSAQVNIDETGGFANAINNFLIGNVSYLPRVPFVFGTERMDVFGAAQRTVCFNDVTAPANQFVYVSTSSGVLQQVEVAFTGPPANPTKLSATPATVKLSAPSATQATTSTLSIALGDQTQQWSAAI